jgi:hypothetical protein
LEATSFGSLAFSYGGVGGGSEGNVFSDGSGGTGGYLVNGRVIKRLKTNGTGEPPSCGIPGNRYLIGGSGGQTTLASFDVVDVSEDGTYVYITTSNLNGVPTLPGTSKSFMTGPAPQLTLISCGGCAEGVDFTGDQTAARAIYCYTRRTKSDFSSGLLGLYTAWVWGRLISFTVNVSKAYTGILGTLTLKAADQFGLQNLNASNVTTTFFPLVDLKQTGTRVITPAAITGSVGSDNLGSVPGNMWFTQGIDPYLSASISGESSTVWPVFTIEVVLDQTPVSIPGVDSFSSGPPLGNFYVETEW